MALSDYKITSFSKPVSALADTPQMSAAALKEWFDSNSTNELKDSVNGIIDETSAVLEGIADEMHSALDNKLDKEDGKVLSSNDYTSEEKAKLASIDVSKYATKEEVGNIETALDGIIDEVEGELSGKVDKEEGKVLSSNDYTNEEKAKLASIDVSKQHTHNNKGILDEITQTPINDAPSNNKLYGRKNGSWIEIVSSGSGSIPQITMSELDELVTEYDVTRPNIMRGVYKLTYNIDDSNTYSYCRESAIVVIGYREINGDLPHCYQTQYTQDGTVLTREFRFGIDTEWSEWKQVNATKEEVGDIETALESIIDIQHELMGVIKFNIGEDEYIAPIGTWSNFINSSYNDGTFTALEADGRTYVVVDDLKVCTTDGYYSDPVYLTDEIISGTTYSLYDMVEI